jgi:hypothetical protein
MSSEIHAGHETCARAQEQECGLDALQSLSENHAIAGKTSYIVVAGAADRRHKCRLALRYRFLQTFS